MSGRTSAMPTTDELLAILRANDRLQAEKDLSGVLGYVALLDKQLAAVTDELRGVRAELSRLKEPGPIMAAWQKLAASLQKQIAALRRQIVAAKDSISQRAGELVAAAKQGGIAALDGGLRFLQVKDTLQSIGAGLQAAANDTDATRKKVAAISAEYREAGKHLRNFGRAIRGKEPLARPKPEGKLSKSSQSFFTGVRDVLAGAASDAAGAVACLNRLERAAAKGREEKTSLKGRLNTYRAALPPPKAPAPEKARQENSL